MLSCSAVDSRFSSALLKLNWGVVLKLSYYLPVQFFFQNLINLGVKSLVLPAAASALNTWTTAFGFTPITKSERSEFLSYNFLDFHDAVICQKSLRKVVSPLPQLPSNAVGKKIFRFVVLNSIKGLCVIVHVLRPATLLSLCAGRAAAQWNIKKKRITPESEGGSDIYESYQDDLLEGSETKDD